MPRNTSQATPAALRRGLYFGGIVYTVSGAVTLIRGIRQDLLLMALLGASWVAVGLAVSLLGDQRAQVQTPRTVLVWVAVIIGAGLALSSALLCGQAPVELPAMAIPRP